jgi:large subunit ribosomal protein L23
MAQVPPAARKESATGKAAAKKPAAPKTATAQKPAAAKPAGPKAAAPKTAPAKGKPTTPATPKGPNPYDIVFHPVVTEKTMFNMDNNNTLEFLVAIWASKPEITKAIETLFTVKVAKVTTRITKDGKRAVVKFGEGVSAEDIGTRIGVF